MKADPGGGVNPRADPTLKKTQLFPRGEVQPSDMKIRHQLFLAAALFAVTLPTNAQNSPPPKDKPGEKWREKFMEGIPEEMRARFEAVREDALKDPELQALMKKADEAREEFRDAMREAMTKRDPELSEKVRSFFEERKKNAGDRPKPRKENQGEKLKASLPPEQRDRLEKAREIAKQAPAVQSAQAKLKAATTPEERHQASQEFHEAMRNAILTADPTLADVLDKIRPPSNPEPKSSAE
jgi:hypothetical protein